MPSSAGDALARGAACGDGDGDWAAGGAGTLVTGGADALVTCGEGALVAGGFVSEDRPSINVPQMIKDHPEMRELPEDKSDPI